MENKVKKETLNEIDNISDQLKKSAKKILVVCADNTAELISCAFDKIVNKIKQKRE